MWKFLEDVFKIRNVCIGATYGNEPIYNRLNIKTKIFQVFYKNRNWEFEIKDEKIYVPYNIKTIERDLEAKRLIPLSDIEKLLPRGNSIYKNKFRKGADLYPRSFIFITQTSKKKIVPDKTLPHRKPWNFFPIEEYDIESEYIYPVCINSGLVPFHLLHTHNCFLPIERVNYKYENNSLKPKAKKVFEILSENYNRIQEKNQRTITSLWQSLNHHNKLIHPKQQSEIKVIYPASGGFIKAAIIRSKIIVDHSFIIQEILKILMKHIIFVLY